MKKFFYVFIFGFISGLISFSEIQRIEFNKWPQMKFRNVRILIANSEKLSNQGFAGATLEEMKNTIIIFPNIPKGVIFTNVDQGYGCVKEDIKIYYLDKNFEILKYDIMKKEKGISIPPENSFIAVEGLP
ncbi:MAG: hypothetical protein NC827_08145 [Candidatus Omnitrophica bacterium]|nr:hypothetical protein [Candidatus Omnitrophota bacterium]MCM8803259.1 hypothetical protein [Candidatus Omnitrophota bacterium]